MRMLFELDVKNYDGNGRVFRRPSARGIIIKDGKAAMIHSRKYDYYKFPGGGIEAGETREEALAREILEEAGLCVIPGSIREYGQARRIQKGQREEIFLRVLGQKDNIGPMEPDLTKENEKHGQSGA